VEFDGLRAVTRLANNLDLGQDFEQSDKTLPHYMMVVYDHRSDSIAHAFISFRSAAVRSM
jgi:hypothetical protein